MEQWNGTALLGISLGALLLAYLAGGAWFSRRWGIKKGEHAPGRSAKDDMDYIPTSTPVLLGYHFASLAGMGFLMGTIQAASFGWLPALLWILAGGIFIGGLLGFSALFVSVRSGGRSLPGVMRRAVRKRSGVCMLVFGWLCLVVFSGAMVDFTAEIFTGVDVNEAGEVVQNSVNGSVAMAIMLFVALAVMFGFINRARMNLAFTTGMGLLLMGASTALGVVFPLYAGKTTWIFFLLIYVFLASAAPVWALVQSRNYLNSLLLMVLMAFAVAGIVLGRPQMEIPMVNHWVNESVDTIFPALFLFLSGGITSGIHGLIAGGTTSKLMKKEGQIRPVGYGAMLLVCLMCVIALIVVGSMTGIPEELEILGGDPFALVRVFAHGLGGFFSSIGLGKPAVSVMRIVVLLIFGSLAMTSLDTSVRTARYLFQELFSGKTGKGRLFWNRYTASFVTVAAVGALSLGGYRAVWEVFPGANLMLAALLLAGVACFMKQEGKKCRLYYFPVFLLLVMAWSDLGILFVKNLEGILAKGEAASGQLFLQNGTILMMMLLSVVVLTDGIRTVFMEEKKMRRMIFATGNQDKMREIREIMADTGIQVLSMKEAGVYAEVEENGKSFEENAQLKARAVCELAGEVVLADDSGLEIDYLNGEPGIYSARYLGEDTSYRIKNANLMDRLEGVPEEKRTARFVCAIAAAFPDGRMITVRETMEGRIAHEEAGENGFGYDPIFYLPEYGCTSAQLSREEKNRISHRGKALRAMKEELV